jgi:hypothetical protein
MTTDTTDTTLSINLEEDPELSYFTWKVQVEDVASNACGDGRGSHGIADSKSYSVRFFGGPIPCWKKEYAIIVSTPAGRRSPAFRCRNCIRRSDSDDENEKQESPYDYMPYLVSHPKGSAKEIEAALRMRGLRLRKDLNQSLSQNPDAWKALHRPTSLHSASLSLAEMLRDIPQNDREQFHELEVLSNSSSSQSFCRY